MNQTTYCETLKLLLEFEEYTLKNSIREFDCENQILSRIPKIPDLLSLKVSDLDIFCTTNSKELSKVGNK